MANVNSPTGFSAVKNAYNMGYQGGIRTYNIPASNATATFIGDPVKLLGSSSTVNGQIFPDVIQGTTGARIVGVVVGFAPDPNNLQATYRVASTQRLVYVLDDPNALFEAQELAGGTPLTADDIGLNIDFVVAAGSTSTGFSGVTLNNATEATTNTLDCKIMGFVQREDNAIGDSARWLIRLNKHQYVDQVAGV